MNTTTNQSQKQEINFQPINAENLLNQHMTLTCEFNKSRMKCAELYKELEEERKLYLEMTDRYIAENKLNQSQKQNEIKFSNNGFSINTESSYGYETYEEIEGNLLWHIYEHESCHDATKAIIEFNNLRIEIKIPENDYHESGNEPELQIILIEDA